MPIKKQVRYLPAGEYGEWIIMRLQEKHTTALKMAEDLFISAPAISHHIHGHNLPTVETALLYYDYLANEDEDFFNVYFRVLRDARTLFCCSITGKTYFGLWLRYECYRRKIALEDVAKYIDRTYWTVRRHVHGDRSITFPVSIKYGEAFQTDPNLIYEMSHLGKINIEDVNTIMRFFDMIDQIYH